jgi:malonyl CoA-acyl carrier protein transacylase/NAD(P)-dependent dehydrogenase (short-subunit alcohol dehydrogenase family)/acyl-CoA thioesterase FadM
VSYFATAYTIHFDDTMAYGSHHFLTAFKFQCAARESFLFGDRVFDRPGVPDDLDRIHLLTADAYARNLHPLELGDRVAILLTLEDWHRASARFCYRVVDTRGNPVCAGFQTLICADAATQKPIPLPNHLWQAMESMREIEEPAAKDGFRECVLAGGTRVESLFTPAVFATASAFLGNRYPSPGVIPVVQPHYALAGVESDDVALDQSSAPEAWVFGGQGVFDPGLLAHRIERYCQAGAAHREQLRRAVAEAEDLFAGAASALLGPRETIVAAIEETPALAQVAIHLQNVLGAFARQSQDRQPAVLLGHSFGEIAAFQIAGCFDLATGVRVVCERVRALEQHAPDDGGLLAVAMDRANASTIVEMAGQKELVIAGRNHPKQTVVSGPLDQLQRLSRLLQHNGTAAVQVPSPTSFHHPRLRTAAAAWYRQLRELPLQNPSHTLYSPIGRRFIAANEDIAAVLASQLLRPFDLQGAVSDVIESGVTSFVDCGSRGKLAKIITQAGLDKISVIQAESEAGNGSHGNSSNGSRIGKKLNGEHNGDIRRKERLAVPRKAHASTSPTENPRLPAVGIVGRGCILPAGANSPSALLAAITEQRSGIVDQQHGDPHWKEDFFSAQLVPDRSTSMLTGAVNDEDIVAPEGVDSEVFQQFSRAQRLACIALAPCVASLKGARRVLCLVGATADGFEDQDVVSSLLAAGLDPRDPDIDARLRTARSAVDDPHSAIQEVFDKMVRPGLDIVLVDAACASSLYTAALGMHALEQGRVDAVVAGGVFCPGPGNSCLFSQFGGTSATGSRPLDATADGVIFSEGAAMVTLRRVADAAQLRLPVAAVVRGVGLSSDGRSSSANVPQTKGQLLSLKRCYDQYGIDPASIDAIEAHATGTPVGDATEVETLRQFYSGRVQGPIPVHSLKALLGHPGWAAGSASLIAACEYLRSDTFPSQSNYRQPSAAVTKAEGVLRVLEKRRALPARPRRIAIDGFGFGGANAHVVLDDDVDNDITHEVAAENLDNELVFVAATHVATTRDTETGRRFDRAEIGLPKGHVVLPDLVDDMDISQKLAVVLADKVLGQLPDFDASLRRQTGYVLAYRGKCERGIEATMRVLHDRLCRNLTGLDEAVAKLNAAHNAANPSGTYTLQCMMPNVASGRAALQMNLNGPNFVVDAGPRSLEAAIDNAGYLINAGPDGGAKLIVVSAINTHHESAAPPHADDEYAAAFAVTNRRYATELNLNVLATVESALSASETRTRKDAQPTSAVQFIDALLACLGVEVGTEPASNPVATAASMAKQSDAVGYPVYVPVWVEAPLSDDIDDRPRSGDTPLLFVASDQPGPLAELSHALSNSDVPYRIVVVGPRAHRAAAEVNDPFAMAVDPRDEAAVETMLCQLDELPARTVVAFDAISSWDRRQYLVKVAENNELCEFMFLFARHNVERLKREGLQLWGLFTNAFDGVIHPGTGPVTGMLKAIHREIEVSRVGTIGVRSRSVREALQHLLDEQRSGDMETEIAYDGQTRLVRRLRETSSSSSASVSTRLGRDSVVLATGGARGVTAVLAEALLQDFNCTVVALGRSEPEVGPPDPDDPQAERDFYASFVREDPTASPAEMKRQYEQARSRWEVHRSLERLSRHGGNVEYLACDVTNADQVGIAVENVLAKYGRIDLLLHGAGVQKSKRLEHRTLAEFRHAFSTKVIGLRNLVEQIDKRLGKRFAVHLLTSAYSIFGNDGQHDYGAANETLDRLAGLEDIEGEGAWSSIAWLAWDAIGMTRSSEFQALAQQRGLAGLTAEEGQTIFRAVLSGETGAKINVPLSGSERARYKVKTVPTFSPATPGRILEERIELATIDCLAYHKVRGTPTLPGAWTLDRMVKTALRLRTDANQLEAVTVVDLAFHRFIRQAEHEPNLRVVVEEGANQVFACVIGDVLHSSGAVLSKDVVFAEATLRFGCDVDVPRLDGLHQQMAGRDTQSVIDPYCHGHNTVELSGPFDCIRDISIGPEGRSARYSPGAGALAFSAVPAVVLDAALRVGAMYASSDNDLFVPVRIDRVVVPVGGHAKSFASAPRDLRTSAPRVVDGQVSWDRVEVVDDIGKARLVIDGAHAQRLK